MSDYFFSFYTDHICIISCSLSLLDHFFTCMFLLNLVSCVFRLRMRNLFAVDDHLWASYGDAARFLGGNIYSRKRQNLFFLEKECVYDY